MRIAERTAMGKRRGGKRHNRNKSAKVSTSKSAVAAGRVNLEKGGAFPSTSKRKQGKLYSIQSKFKAKLEGAKFRWLNERLYTTQGKESFEVFQKDTSLFSIYHQGYRNQVESWPENPLDVIINFVRKQSAKAVVGDFGCGEARLAASVKQKVHSFDLVADPSRGIVACNIADVPLSDASLDVAVFCLSLMGTDYHKFVLEAHRVLKPGGILIVAEVKSRFAGAGSEEPSSSSSSNAQISKRDQMKRGIKQFLKSMTKLGFNTKKQDVSNQMFALFHFAKSEERAPELHEASRAHQFKACRYKKR